MIKKLTILALIAFLPSLTSANYTIQTENVGNKVKVNVVSDYSEIKSSAVQLGYDTSALEVSNLQNGTLISQSPEIMSAEDMGVTYVANSENFTNGQGTLFSFEVSKKQGAEGSDFIMELIEGTAETPEGSQSSAENVSMFTIENSSETMTGNTETPIVTSENTSVKTGVQNIMIFLLGIMLLSVGFLSYSKKEKSE